ncbi:hypothetical protein N7533_007118 [Penicillium manginii]|uniref:uncharacterized protein n=1 Tax=Penicillium manginii TaxID=203109 RepID=UPI002546899F|nr:uncharacterized protein N7533_007118 [Penicillium manginii]KAJ5750090.1 hypothetical protein N7533_007118 [Penicillium manginii]
MVDLGHTMMMTYLEKFGNIKELKGFFDNDEKAKTYGAMCQNVEWSNDPTNLHMEKQIPEMIAKGHSPDDTFNHMAPNSILLKVTLVKV